MSFHDAATGRPLGLVHRDVNPANVLLGIDGDVKLIDFGIAVTRDVARRFADGPNTVLGKLRYMAPEHARGDVVDARSDQWAAAAMLTLWSGFEYARAAWPALRAEEAKGVDSP